jgi:TRAP-type C4-dicarboxylate transport system permease small subunit
VAGEAKRGEAGIIRLARRVIEWWALLGGVVLLGIAVMSTWSATSGFLFGKPLPGDFEMVEVMVAVAAFAFLPYCQLTDANVTADIFTARASRRTVAVFGLIACTAALGIAVILFWRMSAGLQDYRQYVETTAILKFPIWVAYIPALISLFLLIVSCVITLKDAARDVVRPG